MESQLWTGDPFRQMCDMGKKIYPSYHASHLGIFCSDYIHPHQGQMTIGIANASKNKLKSTIQSCMYTTYPVQ